MLYPTDYKIKAKSKVNIIGKIRIQVLVFFSALLTSLFFAQLVFANNLAADGEKLAKIENKTQELEEENTILKVEIAKKSSLTSLSKKAQKMGFDEPDKIITPWKLPSGYNLI